MKSKFVFGYSADLVSEPILWRLIKDYDVGFNILRAEISPGREGSLLVELEAEADQLDKALEWLMSIGVSCTLAAKRLQWNEAACIDCGACTGVCFSGALGLEPNSRQLIVDRDKCVACGLCVKACPIACFRLDFGD